MRLLLAMLLTVLLSGSAFAQAMNPPGNFDLNQVVTDTTGKPVKNIDKRELSVVVTKAFDGHQVGEVITDRGVIMDLADGPNQNSIRVIDPQCDKCPPLDLRWVLSEALATWACPRQQPNPMVRGGGEPEHAECTPEEKKAESDVITMTARFQKAMEIRGSEEKPGPASVALGAGSIKTLQALVAVKYKDNPVIVWRVWSILNPVGTPALPEFGKE